MALLALLKRILGHALIRYPKFIDFLSRSSLIQLLGKLKGFILGSLLHLVGLASLLLLVKLSGKTLLLSSKMLLSFVLSCSIIICHKVLDVLLCYSGLLVYLMTLLPIKQLLLLITV